MRLAEFLQEESNRELANHYTQALNSRFTPHDIPIKITTHFIDRMGDPRNSEPIKVSEVADFFSKLLIKRRKLLQDMEDGSSVQIVDLETDITVPLIKTEGILVATTIMRGSMRQGAQRRVAI
jgi:hypothetical protein